MSVAITQQSGAYIDRPTSRGLADVVELILDKGLVIDAYVRVSLVGIELLTIAARIVIASVDTYLRFAEATNRLDLYKKGGKELPEYVEDMTRDGAKGKTAGVTDAAKEKFDETIHYGDDDREPERQRRSRQKEGAE
jgi:hypothetical protein